MNDDTPSRSIDGETRELCQVLTDRYGTVYGVFFEKGMPYLEPVKRGKEYVWKTKLKRKRP